MSLITQFALFCRQKAITDLVGCTNSIKTRKSYKTYEDKILKNEASEKDSALSKNVHNEYDLVKL